MATNRPTASVTGRHGWNWNQRDEKETEKTRAESRQKRATGEITASEPSSRELKRRVARLEDKLEQKDRQLRYVIDHYERLLSEQNRKLHRQDRSRDRTERDSAGLVDLVREVTER